MPNFGCLEGSNKKKVKWRSYVDTWRYVEEIRGGDRSRIDLGPKILAIGHYFSTTPIWSQSLKSIPTCGKIPTIPLQLPQDIHPQGITMLNNP